MNDLILITSYCDTKKKEDILRNLVNQISSQKDYFDIMVVSHTTIPQDIQNKCNYTLYDSKNELLYDASFKPTFFFKLNSKVINSALVAKSNTHLAIWRMIILGNSLAKNLGYNKIHHVEYDSNITKFDELYDNSKLLDYYNVVYYESEENTLFGSYQAYNLNSLPLDLIELNESKIKQSVQNSKVKNPETMLKELLTIDKNFFVKDKKFIEDNFGLSHFDAHLLWCIPIYNKDKNSLDFFVWNHINLDNIKIKIIYNNKIFNLDHIPKNNYIWRELDSNYDNAKELIILLNNKIYSTYNFTNYKNEFKNQSFIKSLHE